MQNKMHTKESWPLISMDPMRVPHKSHVGSIKNQGPWLVCVHFVVYFDLRIALLVYIYIYVYRNTTLNLLNHFHEFKGRRLFTVW